MIYNSECGVIGASGRLILLGEITPKGTDAISCFPDFQKG